MPPKGYVKKDAKTRRPGYHERYRKRNQQIAAKRTAAWRHNNPERAKKSTRAARLKSKFGITEAQFEEAMRLQGGVCAICKRPPTTRRLAVDHDHKTKRVRGLLCFQCNYRLLGRAREIPEHHERAAIYLRSDFDIRALVV